MAVSKEKAVVKLTPTQLKDEIGKLKEKIEKYESMSRCAMCDKFKVQRDFYLNTDPACKSTFSYICKTCAEKIALRVDKNGKKHEPTKESVIAALRYVDKPFLNSVWNAAIEESKNSLSGKIRTNVWASYAHLIAMQQYNGKTFRDSDFSNGTEVKYEDEATEQDVIDSHSGQDTYDSFKKNKSDVIRLLDYDPFEKESIFDQPFLYAQLLGLLDSSQEANEDMMRTASAITIVRAFLQQSKIDDTIAQLMSDITQLEKNSSIIKSLQDSKSKLTSMIKDLAAESCLSLKNSKHQVKGENTWTGKIKKIKELNLRNGQVNGFDIGTCRGMQQVLDLSNASIMKQLSLDESEWSDMVAELRESRVELQKQNDVYKEINRILLQENLDLKDYLEENGIDVMPNLKSLKDVYSPFSTLDTEEEFDDESDNSSE